MKFAATLIIAIKITLLMGCDIFDNEQNAVFGEIDNEELTVYNISGKDVYINILVTETVPFTFWAPFSKETNKIIPNSSLSIPTRYLLRYEKGKEVTIFFWDSLEPTGEDVKSIIVR